MTQSGFVHWRAALAGARAGCADKPERRGYSLRGFTEEWARTLELLQRGTNRHNADVAAGLFLSRVRKRVGGEAPSIVGFFGQHNVEWANSAFEGR